jgi:biopolymer transport protein TolR
MGFSGTGNTGTESSRGEGLSSEINVTPLIDVLLVLLIIFMVIVPVMPRGLNSSLPYKMVRSVAEKPADGPILAEVEQAESAVRYRVEGVRVERAEVTPRLQELLSRKSRRQMLLRADGKLDFGVVAGVIDAGQAAGANSIGLLTEGSKRSAQ